MLVGASITPKVFLWQYIAPANKECNINKAVTNRAGDSKNSAGDSKNNAGDSKNTHAVLAIIMEHDPLP